MKPTASNAWIVLVACFAAFIYMVYSFVNNGADGSFQDWLLALGGTAVILLMTWQTVKTLLTEAEKSTNE